MLLLPNTYIITNRAKYSFHNRHLLMVLDLPRHTLLCSFIAGLKLSSVHTGAFYVVG